MLLPQQHRIIEDAKFTYSAVGNAFGKQTKAIKEQGKNNLKLYNP